MLVRFKSLFKENLFFLFLSSLVVTSLVKEGEGKYAPVLLVVLLGSLFNFQNLRSSTSGKLFRLSIVLVAIQFCQSVLLWHLSDVFKATILFLSVAFNFSLNADEIYLKRNIQKFTYLFLVFAFFPKFSSDGYFESVFPYRNDLGTFVTVMFFLVDYSWGRKWFKYLVLGFLMGALVLTKNRGSLVLIIAYISLRSLVTVFRGRFHQLKMASIVLLVIFSASYIALLNVSVREGEFLSAGPSLHSDKRLLQLSGRDQLFAKANAIVKENPWGIGPGRARRIFKDSFGINTPHNIYLKFWVEYGWFGVLFLIIVLLVFAGQIQNEIYFCFFVALLLKGNVESMLPFGLSLVSVFLIAPYLSGASQRNEE